MKIAVFGLPGTGKSTLARALAARAGITPISLDAILFSGPRPLPFDEFRAAADRVTSTGQWIVEGNYSKLADVSWHRAETLIWLDYPLPVIIWRITARYARQITGREPNPNQLTFSTTFTAPRSVLRNAIRKYRHNRDRYSQQVKEAAELGVQVLRFRTPRAARAWLRDAERVPDAVASEGNPGIPS